MKSRLRGLKFFPWRRINMFAGAKPVVLRSQNKVSLAVNF